MGGEAKAWLGELRRLGGTAKDFENVPKRANKTASSAMEHLTADGLQSTTALREWQRAWHGKQSAQASALRLVGEKLVTTANTYGGADQDGAGEFDRLPGGLGY